MNSPITLTVSQLNEYISAIITSSEYLNNIYIKGEISNFTNHYKSGHFYFTLKDENSSIKAVMFRSNACRVPFTPENGMKITAHGRVSVYERDGIYQLYCDELIPDGIGALYLAYEQLKSKLQEEGLFSEEYKKPIPKYPQKIGIITAKTGAAIADLNNILSRRYPICQIELFPALVQGTNAPESLIKGLMYFDGKVDTIIIGRGGGSIEDLWAFNDEKLARTIFKCKTPIISAVGHEVDFTICDFVADLRAPTPSAAAELAVPNIMEIRDELEGYNKLYEVCLNNTISNKRERISTLSEGTFFKSPLNYIDRKRTDLLGIESRFIRSAVKITEVKRFRLSNACARLEAMNPLAVLSRGYAAVYSDDGNVISNAADVNIGDKFQVELYDGKIFATATNIALSKRK